MKEIRMVRSKIPLLLLVVGFVAMFVDDQFFVGVVFFMLACVSAAYF